MPRSLPRVRSLLTLLGVLAAGAAFAADSPARAPAAPASATATQAGRAFTYQGMLRSGGVPVDGTVDLQFSLWDAASGGTQLGTTQALTATALTGLFTVTLNDADQFGTNPFDGRALWLSVDVRSPSGLGAFTTLTPREAVTAAPLANGLVPGAKIAGDGSSYLNPVLGVQATNSNTLAPVAILGHAGPSSGIATVQGIGVRGDGTSNIGVMGTVINGIAVYGYALDPLGGVAGRFDGPVNVFGPLYVRGNATIDGQLVIPSLHATLAINSLGPLPLSSAPFATHGGTLVLHYSGSAYSATPNQFIGMQVLLDGNVLDSTGILANPANTHLAFVAKEWVVSGLAEGNHTISLQPYNGSTHTDTGDIFSVTVTELPY